MSRRSFILALLAAPLAFVRAFRKPEPKFGVQANRRVTAPISSQHEQFVYDGITHVSWDYKPGEIAFPYYVGVPHTNVYPLSEIEQATWEHGLWRWRDSLL